MKQKGFTLVELLVALPISALIVLVIAAGYFQITRGRAEIAQKNIAMGDLDNAAHWLVRDLVMAQETSLTPGAPPTNSITLLWTDLTHWALDEDSVEHSVSYYPSGTQLVRNYDGEVNIVGRYITQAAFSLDNRVFTVTLTSQPGLPADSVTRTFSSEMRTDLPP
jgi:prepilin-type N-terminal cleavage/methylation domain-containing protein